MTDRELDEKLIALRPDPVDPAVLERIQASLRAPLRRVRPLTPAGVFAAGFLIIFVAVAIADSAWLGRAGLSALTSLQRLIIFGVLIALAVLSSVAVARDMRPGAQSIRGGVLLGIAVIAIEAVFFSLFHDYSTKSFLRLGVGCFRWGLLCTVPTAMLVWLAVRCGYVVAPISTGAAVGAIAGLTGVAAQELYCPVLTIPHIAVWHGAVLVVSVAAGAVVGWIANSVRTQQV